MELVTADTVKAIQAALAPVAEKIGQGATFAWDVVVHQQYVEGISSLIWAVPAFGIAIAAAVFSRNFWKQELKAEERGGYNNNGYGVMAVVMGIVSSISVCVGFGFITSGVMHILNPNYYALEFFITLGQSAVGK